MGADVHSGSCLAAIRYAVERHPAVWERFCLYDMANVTPSKRLHSIPAPGGGQYSIGRTGHLGLAAFHAGVREVAGGRAQKVSVKLLGPAIAARLNSVGALREEVCGDLLGSHANIVGVLDVTQDKGGVWVVLERIDGVCLEALLALAKRKRVRLPPSVQSRIFLDLLRGLDGIHHSFKETGRSIVAHRALALDSMFVGRDGVSMLLDLGLARVLDQTGITHRAQLAKVLPYVAPEQLSGGEVGPATDTYSLSVLLWELLTGRQLFRRGSARETIDAILSDPLPTDFATAAGVDLEFLRRALSRDSTDRFQSPREMLTAIERNLPVGSAEEVQRWVRSLAPPGESILKLLDKPGPGKSVVSSSPSDAAREAETRVDQALAKRHLETAPTSVACEEQAPDRGEEHRVSPATSSLPPPPESGVVHKLPGQGVPGSEDSKRLLPLKDPLHLPVEDASARAREAEPITAAGPAVMRRRQDLAKSANPPAPADFSGPAARMCRAGRRRGAARVSSIARTHEATSEPFTREAASWSSKAGIGPAFPPPARGPSRRRRRSPWLRRHTILRQVLLVICGIGFGVIVGSFAKDRLSFLQSEAQTPTVTPQPDESPALAAPRELMPPSADKQSPAQN